MKKQGLRGVAAKKYKVKTTDSDHDLPIADRVFKTEAASEQVTRPNQFWASDITYIQTEEGWVFLAIFLDLFTRKVVGFSMEDNMRTELILNALQMALGRQQIVPDYELVGHSDRGSQYAAEAYRDCLESNGITASMSRRANCYDNAFAESFFHTLKVELVHRRNFKTRQEAMAAIFEYIEVWYNRERIHSSLGYKTPMEYELTALAA
jgi:putative transposase